MITFVDFQTLSTDYYVGITCPQNCWQSIRVYSNMQSYNGVATLTFYYYIWETKQKEGDGYLPQLRIKGNYIYTSFYFTSSIICNVFVIQG